MSACGATTSGMGSPHRSRAISWSLIVLGGALAVAPPSIAPTEGAVVGGLTALALCWALARAAWPVAPSPEELTHRELERIWHQVRPVFEADPPWSLWVAWATPAGDAVELSLLERRPASGRVVGGAPSPYVCHAVTRVDPEDVEGAAEAMEQLRADAVEREERGRQAFRARNREVEDRAHRDALEEIEQRTRAYADAQETKLKAEIAAERAAQAEAVARAIREP